MTGILVLVLAVLAAAGLALHRRRVDGRFSGQVAGSASRSSTDGSSTSQGSSTEAAAAVTPSAGDLIAAAIPGTTLDARATLVQFSSAFCAPCRTTRLVLADVAGTHDGVAHLDIDAEQHLDLVRRLDVRRTPTTLVLDAAGRELVRAAGAPRRDQVLSALPAEASR